MDRSLRRAAVMALALPIVALLAACSSKQGDPFEPEHPDGLDSTQVEGIQSGTWTLDRSPYYVRKDVTVPAGKTLTIEPGVVVIFLPQITAAASGPGRPAAEPAGRINSGMIVLGRLVAEGTADRRIDFRPTSMRTAPPQAGDWETIRFEKGSTGSFRHARLLYGRNGVTLNEASVTLDQCVMSNQRFDGINATLSSARLIDCTISTNLRDGVSLTDCDAPAHAIVLEHCNIGNNFRSGIWAVNSTLAAERCDIKNNGLSQAPGYVQAGVHFEGLPGIQPPLFRRCNVFSNLACDFENEMPFPVSADSNYWGVTTTLEMDRESRFDPGAPGDPVKSNCSGNVQSFCDGLDAGTSSTPTITFCWWFGEAFPNFSSSPNGPEWPGFRSRAGGPRL